MYYYIIENQLRPDGAINNSTTVRSTLATALSYYYERQSKMVVSTDFTSVHLMLTDEKLNTIKKDDIETQYTAE